MPDALGSIGNIFKSAAPAITGITAGTGLVGNILNSITRGQQVSNLQSAEKKFSSLTPEQFSSLVTRSEQPLGQDLIQSVNNSVQADMATRGLSQAPGVFAAEEAQTLAPFKMAQQQQALQQVLAQLGLPIEYAQSIINSLGPNANVSPLLQLLMNKGSGPGTPVTPQNMPSLIKLIQSANMGGQTPSISAPGSWDPGAVLGDATPPSGDSVSV
jgi:hypothetical protein